jgi:hypothetical protein
LRSAYQNDLKTFKKIAKKKFKILRERGFNRVLKHGLNTFIIIIIIIIIISAQEGSFKGKKMIEEY